VIARALERVRNGETLSREAMRNVVRAIMAGEGTDAEIADLLRALHERGETLDEVVGTALAMRSGAVPLPDAPPEAIDTCGTGGDHSGTFNISTVAALAVAGAGVPVAKHGNRSATSRCGSADVLEELGVSLEIAPERMARAVREVGIGFLFARACHPAMARVAPIRARIETSTIFNRLGPLTNPMNVRRQLVGVADPEILEPTARSLGELGCELAWVVHSADGLDEISLDAVASVVVCEGPGRLGRFEIEPGGHVARAPTSELLGGDARENAAIARAVLAGEPGPRRDVVLLNAGAALCVAGVAIELDEGVKRAAAALDSGAARDVLDRFVAFTREAAA
jgi:anthranilate phosphoribosyltransferase